ncbi:regulator [Peptococcaceae bacterium SCADC1_2_3]|jgi:AbrB family looped-hinge helix DNA binding protein|nr:regulator [Peptococcaceae bacterium SCADC1_2_3]KFI36227.1 regulator [Peptococcaceae bacterium SCADC1_2_3]KFI36358.1 regulator [Peptococcaceae bacterium SCADC1_2_3]KFI37015.1 regulator [Peptococcaceae bacterium SCADC1_2_3]
MESRISSKGQITLPIAVRKRLCLKTGDVLQIKIMKEGKLILENKMGKEKNSTQKALEILHETAGAWEDMQESGEEFIHKLREEDRKRLEIMGIE